MTSKHIQICGGMVAGGCGGPAFSAHKLAIVDWKSQGIQKHLESGHPVLGLERTG